MDVLADPYFPHRTLVTPRYTLDEVVTPARVMDKEFKAEGFVQAAVTP